MYSLAHTPLGMNTESTGHDDCRPDHDQASTRGCLSLSTKTSICGARTLLTSFFQKRCFHFLSPFSRLSSANGKYRRTFRTWITVASSWTDRVLRPIFWNKHRTPPVETIRYHHTTSISLPTSFNLSLYLDLSSSLSRRLLTEFIYFLEWFSVGFFADFNSPLL